jgi:hypothetical protein
MECVFWCHAGKVGENARALNVNHCASVGRGGRALDFFAAG